MDPETFRGHAHAVVDWMADYLRDAGEYPVRPSVAPGDLRRELPVTPPAEGEPMERILADFARQILPGVTHWNHPRFFAYFPANHSGPSILGEMLSAGLGVNAMSWETCPAATELEEVVLDWLRQLIGLPEAFRGAIQDTASSATLCALVAARERATDFAVDREGFAAGARGGSLRVYVSAEAHSSVLKGARLAGFGADHVVALPVDQDFALRPDALAAQVAQDRAAGLRPCCLVATVGTTSSTALDPLPALADIAQRERLWLHVDAALAGSAALLPERAALFRGMDRADSIVFNPHKWLLTNFDCSACYTRQADVLVRALSVTPEYLRTDQDERVTNFRDWGVPLGRRFRALKLWFVMRSYGVEGLRAHLRRGLELARQFAGWVDQDDDFELLAPVPLNTVCFRYRPGALAQDEAALDRINKRLLDAVNGTGRVYLTHTRLAGRFTLRLAVGAERTSEADVAEAWTLLRQAAAG